MVDEVVTGQDVDPVVVALEVRGGDGDELPVAGGARQFAGAYQQVRRRRVDERRGDEQAGLVAAAGALDEAGGCRPVAADDLPDEPVDFRLCHASSVAARADVRLTLG